MDLPLPGTAKCLLLSCILSILSHSGLLVAQSFTAVTSYTVGSDPVCVCAADVNGDGKVDLIVGNVTSSTLMVLTNAGSGAFVLDRTYSGFQPQAILAVDVNGDGKPDLVSLETSALRVLTNSGGGHFVSAWNFGSGSYSARAADVNGDSKPDIVVGNGMVFTNIGNGTFALASNTGINSGSYAIGIADLNGDGTPDLLQFKGVSNGSDLITLTNAGNGSFGAFATNHLSTLGPGIMCATDINRDGKMDVVVPFYDSTDGTNLLVLTNSGAGMLGSNAVYTVSKGPWCVTAADINGDGWVDLISSEAFRRSSVFTNDGAGHFALGTTLPTGFPARMVIASDLDGDGKLDLVTVNQSDKTISVALNRTTFPTATSTPSLTLTRSAGRVLLSWPADSPGWSLQKSSATALDPASWGPAGYDGYPVMDIGTNRTLVTVPNDGLRLFRLMHP